MCADRNLYRTPQTNTDVGKNGIRRTNNVSFSWLLPNLKLSCQSKKILSKMPNQIPLLDDFKNAKFYLHFVMMLKTLYRGEWIRTIHEDHSTWWPKK